MKKFLKKYPFLANQSAEAVEIFRCMEGDPATFKHLGNGVFELTDRDAAIKEPGVRQAIKALDLQTKLDDAGDEFLSGLGL